MKSGGHHATLFVGDRTKGLEYVKSHIEDTLRIFANGNPDYTIIECERFTIADARSLKERSSQSSLGDVQVFIIAADLILHEAQNALLKLLEEPSPQTLFYFILPTTRQLLPTVQSRLFFAGTITSKISNDVPAQTFVLGSIRERLALVEPIIKKKDREEARRFLYAVEATLRADGVKKNKRKLFEVAHAQQYLTDRSSSLKMLLEHVAVVL